MPGPRVINALNIPFPVTVEIHFDTSMLVDNDLVDPNNYLFNNGAYTTDVEIINDKHVMLHVENLFENSTFTVNVQNVKSITGEIIDQNYNTVTFFIDRPNVPGFASTITSSNGRLKSGSNVLDIQISDSSWYLMTESGIDVIDKISLMNKGYVLDGYGFNTIYVNRN
jgi:hypothetical protein